VSGPAVLRSGVSSIASEDSTMNENVEAQEVEPLEFNDELSDEAIDGSEEALAMRLCILSKT
jgi:hypothetical protein